MDYSSAIILGLDLFLFPYVLLLKPSFLLWALYPLATLSPAPSLDPFSSSIL